MSSTTTLDVAAIKAQFPLLQRQINGQPLVYLDSANTSQKPRSVIEAMNDFMETSYAPINRSAYQLAAEATDAYENARKAARQVHQRTSRRGTDLHQERYRRPEPGGLQLG